MARPRVYRAEAIVLRRMNFGEADRLLVLLTRRGGKVRALAKGSRRPGSKLGGHLELFSVADVLVARGRELDILTQAESRQLFPGLRTDLVSLAYAYYLAEITDALLEEADDAEPLFHCLRQALEALDRRGRAELIGGHYLLTALRLLGFGPELFSCLLCHNPLRPEANYLSIEQGGTLCAECGPSRLESQPLPLNLLKVLRHLARAEGPAALHQGIPAELARESELLVRKFAEHHIDRRLKSPDFIARIGASAEC